MTCSLNSLRFSRIQAAPGLQASRREGLLLLLCLVRLRCLDHGRHHAHAQSHDRETPSALLCYVPAGLRRPGAALLPRDLRAGLQLHERSSFGREVPPDEGLVSELPLVVRLPCCRLRRTVPPVAMGHPKGVRLVIMEINSCSLVFFGFLSRWTHRWPFSMSAHSMKFLSMIFPPPLKQTLILG